MRTFRKIVPFIAAATFAAPAWAANREAVPEMIQGAPSYVRFPPIFIPIIQGEAVTRQIGVTLTLELKEGEEKQPVEEKRLQLNDAFMRDLYVFFQQRSGIKSNDIDEMYLKGRLLKVADNVIGEKTVREVLIQQFFEQKK
jgi:flagellar basal body-associated protein FliL